MAKIQCPHCQAINEIANIEQPCQKCGTIIGAPLSSLDTGYGAPSSDESTANIGTEPTTRVQKQVKEDQTRAPGVVKESPGGEERYE